jgi:hypothetical protein
MLVTLSVGEKSNMAKMIIKMTMMIKIVIMEMIIKAMITKEKVIKIMITMVSMLVGIKKTKKKEIMTSTLSTT